MHSSRHKLFQGSGHLPPLCQEQNLAAPAAGEAWSHELRALKGFNTLSTSPWEECCPS